MQVRRFRKPLSSLPDRSASSGPGLAIMVVDGALTGFADVSGRISSGPACHDFATIFSRVNSNVLCDVDAQALGSNRVRSIRISRALDVRADTFCLFFWSFRTGVRPFGQVVRFNSVGIGKV